MKKIILAITATLLLIITGCKKEDDLSDFVIGTWVSQEVIVDQNSEGIPPEQGVIEITIGSDKYSMKFNDVTIYISFDPYYTVNTSKNQITIPFNPYIYGYVTDNPFPLIYNVEWSIEDRITMTWKHFGGNGTTLIWTRK